LRSTPTNTARLKTGQAFSGKNIYVLTLMFKNISHKLSVTNARSFATIAVLPNSKYNILNSESSYNLRASSLTS